MSGRVDEREYDRRDRRAADVLRRAAAAVVSIMPVAAADLIERAFALLAADDPLRLDVGQEAIGILVAARRSRDAAAVADDLLASPIDNETAARVQTRATRLLWGMGHFDDMRARVDAVISLDGVPEALRAQLSAIRALAMSSGEDSHAALRDGERALAEARRISDPDATADALRALAETARNDGRNDVALGYFQQLRTQIAHFNPADEIISLQLLDRYDVSEALLAQARSGGGDRRDAATAPAIAFAQMWHHYGVANLDGAETEARTLLELCSDLQDHTYACEAHLILCRIAQLRGDLEAANAHLAAAAGHPLDGDERRTVMLALMQAWLAQSEGDAETALACVRRVIVPNHGVRHRWRWQPGWLISASRIAVFAHDWPLAHAISDHAAVLAERNSNVATVAGIAAHTDGLARGDIAALKRAVHVLAASPRPLVRAAAAADLGSALLLAEQRIDGVAALDDAWVVFNRHGAHAEAHWVRLLLQHAGVRRRRWMTAVVRPTEGWGALTKMEHRVARLIADGHSNRSAAAELVLSPHTVAAHLRAIFGKLSVRSRVQLARAVVAQM